MEIIYLKT